MNDPLVDIIIEQLLFTAKR